MTVSTTASRVDYLGDGTNPTFPYGGASGFKIFNAVDLKVYVDTVLQTLNVDYSVTGAGEEGGGNVVFAAGSIPALLAAVAIVRELDITQETDYVELDKFPAETHEAALDKLTMLIQQMAYAITQTTPATSNTDYLGKLAADPITAAWGAAEGGRWWYNTVDAQFKGWNGTDIVLLG